MTHKPFCSIIILNYFGERVLHQTLDSLLKLTYPKDKHEIIIVDNASTDNSHAIMKEYEKSYKHIKTLYLEKNIGFSAGNNQGAKIAKGKYIILLNNDCIVHKDWLSNIVKQPELHDDIFAVNSKIILYPKFFHLEFILPAGHQNCKVSVRNSSLSDFTSREVLNVPVFDYNKTYLTDIPLHPNKHDNIFIDVTYELLTDDIVEKANCIDINSSGVDKRNVLFKRDNEHCRCSISLSTKTLSSKFLHDKIQNAGIVVYSNGGGRDRGAMVRRQTQDYEIDVDQFNSPAEVYATCGAASLYRKDIFDKLGGLSEKFFMYYEDVELSERARRSGYRNVYEPDAEVRHMHALSSEEGSPFFLYHAEKGRLLHMILHFPMKYVVKELKAFIADAYKRHMYLTLHNENTERSIQYVRISKDILLELPGLLALRNRINKQSRISQKELLDDIFSGSWLINQQTKV